MRITDLKEPRRSAEETDRNLIQVIGLIPTLAEYERSGVGTESHHYKNDNVD